MSLAQLIPIVLAISIGLIVFCLALRTQPGDLSSLLRNPSLLVRSVLAMNVIMPVLAAGIATLSRLPAEVRVALILLAVSPVPPVLPGKQGKAGGNVSYAIGLLVVAAVVSIVTVPLTVSLIGRFFGRDVDVPATAIAMTVGKTVLLPLLAGAIVRRLAPALSARIAKPLSLFGTILLVVALIPVLIASWPAVSRILQGASVVAIVVFTAAGLLVGHLLGGPDPDDRTVLGLASATRHPGVAMTIAGAITSAENQPAVTATILLAVLVGIVVTIPYVKLRRRTHVIGASAPAPSA